VPKPRLLVIDDEPAIGELVAKIATKAGFNAISVNQPGDFANKYNVDIDVIVVDLFMPDMDGVELIRFLGDNNSRAALILISGIDSHILYSARELAEEHGLYVIGTLAKPFRNSDLRNLLTQAPRTTPCKRHGTHQSITEEALRSAIANDELVVHFQPKIRFSDRSLASVEALVRWQHPERGLLGPGVFIPVAEKTGLIDDLTGVVFDKSLSQCRAWLDQGLEIKVAVNMSASTLTDLDFPEHLSGLINGYGLDPSLLTIEVTETAVMNELLKSLDILTRLRIKGIQLSIDDFGTGFSSMQQLVKIPFTEMKIDQSFVSLLDRDAEARIVTESAIELGHNLGMTVVAEGIETQPVWDHLARAGCDLAQGYLIAKPMAGDDIVEWQRTHAVAA